MFDLSLDELAAWITSKGWSRVALQMPEGVKSSATSVIDELSRRTGASFIMMGDPCYGACDLSRDHREYADALLHFGHSPMPSLPVGDDVLFVEMRAEVGLGSLVEEALPLLGERVGILATLQYLDLVPEAAERLEASGRSAAVGIGDSRIAHPGQVLGCNHSSAAAVADQVDSFLFIGEGDFHALAASLGTGRDVVLLDPLRRELRSTSERRERLLRQRFAAITAAAAAEEFIVIVSSKTGQRRMRAAEDAAALIRSKGRKAYLAVMEEISPAALAHYRVGAFVSTACPRVAIDDAGMHPRPVLTPPELEIALGERDWEDYEFDAIIGVD